MPRKTFRALEVETTVNGYAVTPIERGRSLVIVSHDGALHYQVVESVDRQQAALLHTPPASVAEGVEILRKLGPVPA